jgi:hypothetical protein
MRSPVRSYKKIRSSDLKRLAEIAQADRMNFFARYPRWAARYSNRLLCVALCQGAALHFIDNSNGIKDFDVWSFFREKPRQPIRRRRVVCRDLGLSTFGKSPDRPEFIGRKVDLLFKSIACLPDAGPASALQQYLAEGRTRTARCLAQKAVVLIEPADLLGFIAWPLQTEYGQAS